MVGSNKSRCYVDPDVYQRDLAMNRKSIFAVVSVLAVALVMFPLNLLWVGQSPLHAAVSSLPVRPARTAHGMDAQRAVCRRPGRISAGLPREHGLPHPAPGAPDRTVPEDRAVLPDHTVPADRTEPAGRKSLLAKVRAWGSLFSCWRRCWHTIFRPKASPSEGYEGSRIRSSDTARCRWISIRTPESYSL